MGTSVFALIIANSPFSPYYAKLLDLPLEIRIGTFGIAKPLLLWINDGLMAVFFFLVGMELKREVLEGHLSSLRQASLPAFAAIGGMLAPAVIYAALNRGDSVAMRGWAIPTATDIAFALGVLTLLGKRVPAALKAFLLSVAIFDDLGAIVVIALFYTAELSMISLVIAACLILGLACLNRWNVTRSTAYFLLGIPLWVAVLKSGVHATLAGVVLAMFIPMRVPEKSLASQTHEPLLHHLEHKLHPWVAFGVLPVFAFANAGVALGGMQLADLTHPIPLGITFGLFFGKQVGVMLVSVPLVLAGLARLPSGTRWPAFYGAAVITGIGFTMSLFIGSLAFKEEFAANLPVDERIGILLGSALSAIVGYLVLRFALRRSTPA